MPSIDPLSTASLHIQVLCDDTSLGDATGFFIQSDTEYFFVTNRHVVTGVNFFNRMLLDQNCRVPNRLNIFLHSRILGEWVESRVDLLDKDGSPLWIEKEDCDVILLPFPTERNDLVIYPVDLASSSIDIMISPSSSVSVVGYPNGKLSCGKFPIWKTGHVASDYEVNYYTGPSFLIDATTRSGMSGSSVFAGREGGYQNTNGGIIYTGGLITKFLGVYSGRVLEETGFDSSIGIVWKPENVLGLLSIRKK